MIIILPNRIQERLLADVISQMQTLGAPTIRAAWDSEDQVWRAIEGSHRVIAAQQLGLAVTIERVEWDEEIADHDIERFLNETVTVETLIGGLDDPQEVTIDAHLADWGQ